MTKVNRKEARYLAPEAVAESRRRVPLATQVRNDGAGPRASAGDARLAAE